MLRSQAEHHAGMSFLPSLSDTCGERPAILTSRTATFSQMIPPRLCLLPQYSVPVTAPLRQQKKRRLKQMNEPTGAVKFAHNARGSANHNSERLIADVIADQLV